MADLALRHATFKGDTTFYYYDGEIKVKDGVLVLPSGRDDLFTRAWRIGYQFDPVTGQPLRPEEARALLSV